MKHIIFYSGGIGSWMTTKRVIEKEGKENVICLFTDTLIEDDDLYRFLLETTQEMFGIDQSDLIEKTKHIPSIGHETMEDRKDYLSLLAAETTERNPHFVWLNDGRDVWDVFKDVRFLGNSRQANCSHELKQKMSKRWIQQHAKPEECVLYMGIDWSEDHRTVAPKKNWLPYTVEFPMCEEPFLDKQDMLDKLNDLGIPTPKLYDLGFSHNNCSGFCVRAGQGHFINLLLKRPELYKYSEEKEEEMRQFLDRDVSILKRTRKGEQQRLTLKKLREEYFEKHWGEIDFSDVGGCGCFVDDES